VYEDTIARVERGNNVAGGRERAEHAGIRKHLAHETIRGGRVR
jgi:hypothetical protein